MAHVGLPVKEKLLKVWIVPQKRHTARRSPALCKTRPGLNKDRVSENLNNNKKRQGRAISYKNIMLQWHYWNQSCDANGSHEKGTSIMRHRAGQTRHLTRRTGQAELELCAGLGRRLNGKACSFQCMWCNESKDIKLPSGTNESYAIKHDTNGPERKHVLQMDGCLIEVLSLRTNPNTPVLHYYPWEVQMIVSRTLITSILLLAPIVQ